MRLVVIASGAIFASVPGVQAAPVDPSIGRVEVTLDLPKDKPYVGEMIMLRMRSFIHADVVLDEVKQPPLIDFDVQQLGRDKPIQAMVGGFNVDGIERDLAIFPDQAGRLIIPAFTRHVTIVDHDGQRVEADFSSKPVYVDVQTYAGVNATGTWWLPAKSLTISDTWSPEPDEIDRGSLSRRTIVVEAAGLDADRLPPPPDMRAPGIIAFRGPVKRETVLTEDGPIARATYSWDLRPATGAPAKLPAITVPWFDTSERRMRQAAVPERWVAYVGTFVHPRHDTPRGFGEMLLAPLPVVAGLTAFAWTAALLGILTLSRRSPGARRSRPLASLRRTASFRDESGFLRALDRLSRSDPGRWAMTITSPDVGAGLAALDAARYARHGGAPTALQPFAAVIERRWNEVGATIERKRDRLPPLDGPVAEKRPRGSLLGRVIARG